MTIGYLAVFLIGVISLTGVISVGILRIRTAKTLGRITEARGRVLQIFGVCLGLAIMLVGAFARSRVVGIIGGAVLICGVLLGLIIGSTQASR